MKGMKVWRKRGLTWLMALALFIGMVPAVPGSAAKKVKLSKTSIKLTVGKKYKLKLKNNKKKASWKVTSGKKNVKLKAKKKTGVTIVAKKKGTAKVQAKVGKKRYTCKVKIVNKKKPTPQEPESPTDDSSNPSASDNPFNPDSSEQPSETNVPGTSGAPQNTSQPGVGGGSNPPITSWNPPITSWNPPSPTTDPGTGENPGTNPEATAKASTNPSTTTTPEATANPSVNPNTTTMPGATANPSVNPKASATPKATAKASANPKASATPKATAKASTNPKASATPKATAKASTNPKATATPKATTKATTNPTAKPTATPTPTPTAKPTPIPTPTNNPGNIDLGNKTVFKVGTHNLALGITKDQVKSILGSVTREGKSPQGFDTIVYNPGGNYDGYTIIYLKNNEVVSICAIGKNVSYGDIVQTGKAATDLASNGWSPETWFDAKEGKTTIGHGAYKYSASNPAATVLAYVDFFRLRKPDGTNTLGNKVYCIQAFSSTIAWDDMRYPANCHYEDPAVMTELKQETAELLIAYRKYICNSCDYSWTKYPLSTKTGLAEAAQTYCDAAKTNTDAPPAEQNADKLKEAILAKSDAPMHFAQITMSTSSDAIGFANSALNQQGTSDYIINFSKTDKRSNGTAYKYWYQYFGIGATAYRASEGATWHTYMVIDLVDLWDGDSDW